MRRRLANYRVFLREFRRTYRTTGAILPSGRALALELVRSLRELPSPCRILEVGPGTGAVTDKIASAMKPDDRLDLVELNSDFVRRLEHRFAQEPALHRVADRVRILHQSVESVPVESPYDVVISGLPLNNFGVAEVEQILESLVAQLRPGGTLSFFEYLFIRRAKAIFSGAGDRDRLRGIGAALSCLFQTNHVRHRRVLANVPPAWVHHVTVADSPQSNRAAAAATS